MKAEEIFGNVLKKIKPTRLRHKEISIKIDTFLSKLQKSLKKNKLDAKAVLGGSFAKDTWLINEFDVDIFVKFSPKYADDKLSELLAKAIPKATRVHGSRDYFHIKKQGIHFEIVPVLNIKKPAEARNVTDVSPKHVEWAKKNVGKLHDDIRIAKKFMKANKLYGAESYINGFSGHVMDILIIHYGGFLSLLKATKKWKDKTILDTTKEYKGRVLHHLNVSKTQGPLVIVDPVQKDRNAAAAVNLKKFKEFKKIASKFLQKPSMEFFEETKIDIEHIKKQNGFLLEIISLEGKQDVVGAKILKIFEYLRRELESFGIKKSDWDWHPNETAVLGFILETDKLPKEYEQRGPPTKMIEAVKKFKKKHKKTFVKTGYVYATRTHRITSAEKIIRKLLESEYVKERCKRIKLRI